MSAQILVRTYRSKENRRRAGSMAVIIWPLEPATTTPGDVTCWHRIGHYSGADLSRLIAMTRPATEEEIAVALRQWRSEGPYRTPEEYQFTVLKRAPSWSRIIAAHRGQLRLTGRK